MRAKTETAAECTQEPHRSNYTVGSAAPLRSAAPLPLRAAIKADATRVGASPPLRKGGSAPHTGRGSAFATLPQTAPPSYARLSALRTGGGAAPQKRKRAPHGGAVPLLLH